MEIVPLLKSSLEKMPVPVGYALACVPYAWRGSLGRIYSRRRQELRQFEASDARGRREFIFRKVQALVAHSHEHVPFYKWYYDQHGFSPKTLASFADLASIPIVTKNILNEWPLEKRSAVQAGRYLANTGGSSGQPFAFYIMPALIPHEWAHMHTIWERLGYRSSMLKIGLGGRDLQGRPVRYDALRHQYSVSIYEAFEMMLPELRRIACRREPRYLHGYPSAIYEFACLCETDAELHGLLRESLRGVFLGSEFPLPAYRRKIEEVFGVRTISWYGHTERSVLAGENREAFFYEPFQTYGYAEALAEEGSGCSRLVGTSYHNFASPLIRYDTGDEIEASFEEDGLLAGFRMRGGRQGEFVLDGAGKRIPLTGLIHGRHHRAFAYARFVQVYQREPGRVTLLVTPLEPGALHNLVLSELFDLDGVAIEFSFMAIAAPIRTERGKVLLKVATLPEPAKNFS